ncbi:MAG: FAD-dependent oxidoreductase [Alphaproteobacteria bacterium]|nr:FAD-dependent oxidoreductase [Alphaproteobacteria bacterium]
MTYQIVIMGAGPAGYTAALYAARAALSPVVVTGALPGGQLVYTQHIQNFPGFIEKSGPDLVDAFRRQVEDLNVPMIFESVTQVDLSKRPFTLTLSSNETLQTESVIIATGSSPKTLGVDGEARLTGRGVSVCATCDGFFYKGRRVCIIGGGNSALYEALFLTRVASQVFLIYPADELKGEEALLEQVKQLPNLVLMPKSQVLAFEGENKLSAVRILRDGVQESLAVDGAFVAIGQKPNTALFSGQLDMDEQGYLVVDKDTQACSVPGVFACGDVQNVLYRQAIIACGSGAIAALSAQAFLKK